MDKLTYAFMALTEDFEVSDALDQVLKKEHKLIYSSSLSDARVKIENQKFDCIIVDLEFIGKKTLEFVLEVKDRERFKSAKDKTAILVVGGDAQTYAQEYIVLDNVIYLEKPFDDDELKAKLSFIKSNTKKIEKNTRNLSPGEVLIDEGGKNHDMFWVISGTLTVYKTNAQGEEKEIGKIVTGELVGEMSFLDNLPRSASVKADTDCEVLCIPNRNLMSILDSQPRWFQSIVKTLSKRLREVNDQLAKN